MAYGLWLMAYDSRRQGRSRSRMTGRTGVRPSRCPPAVLHGNFTFFYADSLFLTKSMLILNNLLVWFKILIKT